MDWPRGRYVDRDLHYSRRFGRHDRYRHDQPPLHRSSSNIVNLVTTVPELAQVSAPWRGRGWR